MRRLIEALTFASAFAVCGACGGSRGERPPPRERTVRSDAVEAEPRTRAEIPAAVRTTVLVPREERIAVADLPPPFASESVRRPPEVIDPPADAALQVPQGFVVQRFAEGLTNPRWLAQTSDGRVLVAQSRENRIVALRDRDADGVAEETLPFADERNTLDLPFGMAFAGGHFYVGNQSEVRRYPFDGQARLEGRGERVIGLPGGGYNQHWTRNVIVAADGAHLFVSVGSRTNADPEEEPRATIQSIGLNGEDRRTFASGLRNPVGLAIHPRTGALFTTVNERDHLGDDLVPDYFTEVHEGAFYGWPYAYLAPNRLDPRAPRNALSARTRTPDVLFPAHSAALGVAFYQGTAFPERYRNGAFVAHRGSWNRGSGTGYRIVFVPFDGDRPRGTFEDFVTGFLVDPAGPTTWGRPVGVLVIADGSLLFTDETGGIVYRVSHR